MARRDKASLRSFLTLEVCFEVFPWKKPMLWSPNNLPCCLVLLCKHRGSAFFLVFGPMEIEEKRGAVEDADLFVD
jgi:hypothetical protein